MSRVSPGRREPERHSRIRVTASLLDGKARLRLADASLGWSSIRKSNKERKQGHGDDDAACKARHSTPQALNHIKRAYFGNIAVASADEQRSETNQRA